jgi:hypothetical protein
MQRPGCPEVAVQMGGGVAECDRGKERARRRSSGRKKVTGIFRERRMSVWEAVTRLDL